MILTWVAGEEECNIGQGTLNWYFVKYQLINMQPGRRWSMHTGRHFVKYQLINMQPGRCWSMHTGRQRGTMNAKRIAPKLEVVKHQGTESN